MGKSRHFWKYMPNSKFLFIEQYNTQGVTVTVAPFPIPPSRKALFYAVCDVSPMVVVLENY